jgi:gliding motility-associated-like protein
MQDNLFYMSNQYNMSFFNAHQITRSYKKKQKNLIYNTRTKLIFALLLFVQIIQSQCIVNTINADFEYPIVYGSGTFINQNDYPNSNLGWRTTASDNQMEFWTTGGIYNIPAYSGRQFIELNANVASGFYQDFNTSTAIYIDYSFAHRGRLGTDTMVLKAGPPNAPYTEYTVVQTASTSNTDWKLYEGRYIVPAGQIGTRFIFTAVSTSNNDPSKGNFLDAINFTTTIDLPTVSGTTAGSTSNTVKKTICYGTPVTLYASGMPGATFFWYDSDENFISQGTSFTTPTLYSNKTYKIKQRNSTGCDSHLLNIEIDVNSLPAPIIIETDATCSPSTAKISNYNPLHAYTFDPDPLTISSDGVITGMREGRTYKVRSIYNGCSSNFSREFIFTDSVVPEIPAIKQTAATCSAPGSSRISNYTAGNLYIFTPAGPQVNTSGVITGMIEGTNYQVAIKTNEGCMSPNTDYFRNASQLITPATPLIIENPATCTAPGSSQISNYAAGNTYNFTPTGPAVRSTGTITGMTETTSYTVTASNAGCTSPGSALFSNANQLAMPATPLITQTNTTYTAPGSIQITNYIAENNYIFTPTGPDVTPTGTITGMAEATFYTVTSGNANCTSPSSQRFYKIDPSCSICNGELQTILQDDFGSGISDRGPQPSSADFTTSYSFSSSGGVGSNSYSLMKNASQVNSSWSSGGDHTTGKNGNGYMLIFDANTTLGSIFYEKKYSDLCAGSLVTFTIYAANLISTTYQSLSVKPIVRIDLINPTNQTILKSFISSELPLSQEEELLWNELSMSFTIPPGLNNIILRASNAQSDTNTNGNDIAFDDISFNVCVPLVTIAKAQEITCEGNSATLLAANHTTSAIAYSYQWQQLEGNNWVDISGATSLQYTTPTLNENKSFRIRYAQTGIDITNNNNLRCSGNKEIAIEITPKPTKISIEEEICEGNSYTWPANNTTYSTAGTYTKNNDNCTADQELVLTVTTKPTKISTPAAICSGDSYTWTINNTTYTTAGTYTINNDNCTADQELVLTVTPKPTKISTPATICSGDSYTWTVNNTAYTTAGTYTINNDNCTADQELVLTVTTKPTKINIEEEICEGNSYTWPANNITYNAAGTYTKNNDNCTADQELVLTVKTKPTKISIKEEICEGNSYTWPANNITYSTAGTYTKNNGNCTADQELVLTVTPKPTKISTPAALCSGDSYTWTINNTAYTTAGTYTINNDNCTADQELVLTVTPKPTKINIEEEICEGNAYTWAANNTTYTTAGTYTINNDNCTADQELVLTVTTKPTKISTPAAICSGDSYTWTVNNTTYTTAGTYTINNDNCTADQELVLTVLPPITLSISPNSLFPELCAGDKTASFSIEINGGLQPYQLSLDDQNGTYQQIFSTEYTYSNLAGGTHIVYVKDALNCTSEIEIVVPHGVSVDPIATVSYSCQENSPANSVIININRSLNSANVDYALDGGNYQLENIFTNVSSGTHTITARHTNGCIQSTQPFVIKDIQPLTLLLTNGELNEIVANATGGDSGYEYSFDNQSYNTDNKLIIYKSGIYTVTVTDKKGCTATVSKYFEYIDICIQNYFTPNGDGINDQWGPDCTINYKNLTYTVFDRYGRTIATYKLGQKWDGKYNGTELTSGDYWYVLKLNDPKDNREFVGHFTLYR